MDATLNILVVEDHDSLREVLVELLISNGYRALGVASAEDVEDNAAAQLFNLLIVDINLPGEDGLSLSRRCRAAQPDALIMMMTVRNELVDRLSAYESGADIYMPKPLNHGEFLAAVKAIARRHATTEGTYSDGVLPVTLDTNRFSLQCGSRSVEISSQDVSILASLARASGRVLQDWQLLGLAYGEQNASRNALELRITRIRKKFVELGIDKQVVRSVRGQGYRLDIVLRLT